MVAFKAADVDRFIARPDPARPVVLVFGPDAGLVRERAETLVRTAIDDPKDPFQLARLPQGQAGGQGGAHVRLSQQGESTRLAYDVKASVGGKLAQIGSRLVDAAAKKVADDFFRTFNQKVGELHGKSNPPG